MQTCWEGPLLLIEGAAVASELCVVRFHLRGGIVVDADERLF